MHCLYEDAKLRREEEESEEGHDLAIYIVCCTWYAHAWARACRCNRSRGARIATLIISLIFILFIYIYNINFILKIILIIN